MSTARICRLILFCGALIALLFFVPAFAEDAPDVEVTAAVSPASLSGPGDVTFTIRITNRTSDALEELRFAFSGQDEADAIELDPVDPFGSATVELSHPTTDEELDAGSLGGTLSGRAGDKDLALTVSTPLSRNNAVPELTLQRKVSTKYLSENHSVVVVYRILNDSPAPALDVSLEDPLGEYSAHLDSLAPGGRAAFVHTVAAEAGDISQPVLTSRDESGRAYEVSLEPVTFVPANSLLDVEISANRALLDPDTIEVVLTLSNRGNVDILGISVYDEVYGGVIAESLRLPAGSEALTVSRAYPTRGDAEFRWRVLGQTEGNDPVDIVTDTITFPADSLPDVPDLQLSAETSMPRINRSGYIPVALTLHNAGTANAWNVVISDETIGEVCRLTVVPTGEDTVRTVYLPIEKSGTIQLVAGYQDADGLQHTVSAEPFDVSIGGGQTPLNANGTAFHRNTSMPFGESSLFMTLLIAASAVLVLLIVMLIVTGRRSKRRRREQRVRPRPEPRQKASGTAPKKKQG